MQVGEVYGDAWEKGAVIAWMDYQWVPLWRVSSTCHGCKYFQAQSCLLIFIFYKMLIKGHFLGLVTSGGNVSHKHFTEMRRLARDETPFLLAMPKEPLPWRGDQMLVVSYR